MKDIETKREREKKMISQMIALYSAAITTQRACSVPSARR